ncbi:helix-turn-helix domain-containing protein [Nocardioides maradonensis]
MTRQPDYLTPAAAAVRTGVSEKTIRAAVRRGDLAAWQPGGWHGRILIRPADLTAWANRGWVSPRAGA